MKWAEGVPDGVKLKWLKCSAREQRISYELTRRAVRRGRFEGRRNSCSRLRGVWERLAG